MNRCFRVFLLEDDARQARVLERLLAGEGYLVQTLDRADGLYQALQTQDPACLILERSVGGVSGLEIFDAIEAAGLPVPVIFLVAEGDIATCRAVMLRGAVDYLVKPVAPSALSDALRRAEALSRARQAADARRKLVRERLSRLTRREHEVLSLVLAGRLNKQIAAELSSREATVKVHRSRLMRKLETQSLAELLRLVRDVGPQVAQTHSAGVAMPRFTEPNARLLRQERQA